MSFRFFASRPARYLLALPMVVAAAGAVTAQSVSHARTVEFTPSSDHDSAVARYELEFYQVGASTPFQTFDLGKPGPDGDGTIRVDFGGRIVGLPLPGGTYEARVAAVGAPASGAATVQPLHRRSAHDLHLHAGGNRDLRWRQRRDWRTHSVNATCLCLERLGDGAVGDSGPDKWQRPSGLHVCCSHQPYYQCPHGDRRCRWQRGHADPGRVRVHRDRGLLRHIAARRRGHGNGGRDDRCQLHVGGVHRRPLDYAHPGQWHGTGRPLVQCGGQLDRQPEDRDPHGRRHINNCQPGGWQR